MNEDRHRPKSVVKKPIQDVLSTDTARVVRVCREIIDQYSLDVFLNDAGTLIFEALSAEDKEKLCAGMIKLGEALTYCRDGSNETLQNTGICNHAIKYARVRNHFVHYHVYHAFVKDYKKLNIYLQSVESIESLKRSLISLESCGVEILSKKIELGSNNFKFEYLRFVKCLRSESVLLNEIITELKGEEIIPLKKKIFLENRVRNILVILMDLLDEKNSNLNLGQSCKEQKKIVLGLNEQFKKEDKIVEDFFSMLRSNRNSLCHFESGEDKPYEDDKQMLDFAGVLNSFLKKGYIETLEKNPLIVPVIPQVEILGKVATKDKPKPKAKLPTFVVLPKGGKEEEKREKKSGLGSLLAYNKATVVSAPAASEDADSVQKPEAKKGKKESPLNLPRMGSRK